MAFVYGGDEGRLYKAEVFCVEVFGKFAFGGIMVDNADGLVKIEAFG